MRGAGIHVTALIPRRKICLLRFIALSVGCFLAIIASLPTIFDDKNEQIWKVKREDSSMAIHTPIVAKSGSTQIPQLMIEDLLMTKINKTNVKSKRQEQSKLKTMHDNKALNDVRSKNVVNPHPFKFVLTPDDMCRGDQLAIAFVHSAPARYNRRDILRATWGNTTYHTNGKLKVIYVIASHKDHATRQAIAIEHQMYHDILSEDFIDDYKNLTYKAVGALKWITSNCKKAKFIIKTDDDTLVNVFSLLRHLADLKRTKQTSKLLMCRYIKHMPVLRAGKWAVAKSEYPEFHYPPYCSGLAYIMTMDVAKALYEASYETPNMWVDDAWLTGQVAQRAGVKHTNIVQVYSLNKSVTEKKFLGDEWYQYLFAHLAPPAFKAVWAKMHILALHEKIPESKTVIPGVIVSS